MAKIIVSVDTVNGESNVFGSKKLKKPMANTINNIENVLKEGALSFVAATLPLCLNVKPFILESDGNIELTYTSSRENILAALISIENLAYDIN